MSDLNDLRKHYITTDVYGAEITGIATRIDEQVYFTIVIEGIRQMVYNKVGDTDWGKLDRIDNIIININQGYEQVLSKEEFEEYYLMKGVQ